MAPPGGLLSPALSAAVAPWCTSLITGKDAVPRLSLTTARLLMDHCVYALAMCRLPKMQCAPCVADCCACFAWRDFCFGRCCKMKCPTLLGQLTGCFVLMHLSCSLRQ